MRTKTAAVEERMLDAAGRLFGSQRFHEVRMEDIAAEAEVGKGTLYRYWNDKEELYLALVARASHQFLERLREAIGQGDSPRARLERLVTAIISFFDDRPQLFDLIQRAEVLKGPDFPWRAARQELFRQTTVLFEEASAVGEAVCDPELSGHLLLGGLRTVIRFGKRPRSPELAREIMDVFLPCGDGPANSKSRKSTAVLESARTK